MSTTSHQPKVDKAKGKADTQTKTEAKPGKVLDFQPSDVPGSDVNAGISDRRRIAVLAPSYRGRITLA